uniref:Uncharacterized protein n=1 Tax=Tremella fuciformis TaxID=64657 RepID=A0A2H4QBR2_9TREE|nr:hypothetical protein [Tremella fuciformis]
MLGRLLTRSMNDCLVSALRWYPSARSFRHDSNHLWIALLYLSGYLVKYLINWATLSSPRNWAIVLSYLRVVAALNTLNRHNKISGCLDRLKLTTGIPLSKKKLLWASIIPDSHELSRLAALTPLGVIDRSTRLLEFAVNCLTVSINFCVTRFL